jgi:FlaA1/EpsC-like NDP-sugar epimerase
MRDAFNNQLFFIKLQSTGELPIIDLKMTRFMISLEESVEMV